MRPFCALSDELRLTLCLQAMPLMLSFARSDNADLADPASVTGMVGSGINAVKFWFDGVFAKHIGQLAIRGVFEFAGAVNDH